LTLAVALVATARGAPRDAALPQAAPLTEADIDRLEAELTDPEKRLPAIAALAAFSSFKLYKVGSVIFGDEESEALRERAAMLACRHRDLETVRRALDSEDVRLQTWGLWFWRGGIYEAIRAAERVPLTLPREDRTREETAWHALTPKLRRLAQQSPMRHLAVQALTICGEENQEFLRSLIPQETSAGMILQLCDATITRTNEETLNGRYEARDRRFNQELQRLLTSTDAEVRHEALANIAMTWNSAEMWQTHFSSPVLALVAKLRNSEDAEDRRLANWAKEGVEKLAKQRLEKRREQRRVP